MNTELALITGDLVALRVDDMLVEGIIVEVASSDLHDIDTYVVQVDNDFYPIYADEVLRLSVA